MKTFNVTYNFVMVCETRNLTIQAESAEEALEKCQQALDGDVMNNEKFRALGGDDSGESWDTCPETSSNYSIDEDGIEEAS